MSVHPTAVIHPAAVLGDVEIGPYAVVGPEVVLADGVVLHAHVVVDGPTEVGPRTVVHPHAVLGGPPQDAKHDGSATRLVIGADCILREYATAHRGSSSGRGVTEIGDGCWLMCSAHVAHDCKVGDRVTLANSVALAGHVDVGDDVVFGGLSAIHQHGRVGRLAMVGGGAMCAQDVPPFALVKGDRARIYGINRVGLQRAGLGGALPTLTKAWRTLFGRGLPLSEAIHETRTRWGEDAAVSEVLTFLEAPSLRGVCRAPGQAERG